MYDVAAPNCSNYNDTYADMSDAEPMYWKPFSYKFVGLWIEK